MSKEKKEVLRRTSFIVLSWIFTIFFFGVISGIASTLPENQSPVKWGVMCVSFWPIVVGRRIWSSRIKLGKCGITVINPIFSHFVPYKKIASIWDTGSLTVVRRDGLEVIAVGFGGSVIDHFVGSTSRAADKIEFKLRQNPPKGGEGDFERKITRAYLADFCLLASLVCGVMAGVVN